MSQSTSHQRLFAVMKGAATLPAFMGGSTFSTSAFTSSLSSNVTLIVLASIATALCKGRYSTRPG